MANTARQALICALVLLTVSTQGVAGSESLAVLYPETVEPYRSVYEEILQGIESQAKVTRYPLPEKFDQAVLVRNLDSKKPVAVVALGQRGVRAANDLNTALPVIAGAVFNLPAESRAFGIGLSPDPEKLFARLRALAPQVQRVVVVYSTGQNGELIERARMAAERLAIGFKATAVADLRDAALAYRTVLADCDEKTAIWLLPDRLALDEELLVPLVLERAWTTKAVVFSSSLGHVTRGALFALYPDNAGLGRRLAGMALESERVHGRKLMPLQDVRLAINTRTAAHLGLDRARAQAGADLVFPVK
jgi:putative ABC transport system substrate-binding protein